jgi:hypothetical protein
MEVVAATQPTNPVAAVQPRSRLRVIHYEHIEDKHDAPAREIGSNSFATRFLDRVVVEVNLPQPEHCFLIGCNVDGKEQLLWPCDEKDPTYPGDPNQPPTATAHFRYPPLPPGVEPAKGPAATLDDRSGGMQAFLLVAARQPLPAYADWVKKRGPMPWEQIRAAPLVLWSDGEQEQPRSPKAPGGEVVRLGVAKLNAQSPIKDLCGWAKGPEVDLVEALAFPVYSREDK